MKTVGFKIAEQLSDDYDLKESLEKIRSVVDVLSSLFGIKRSRMLTIEGDDDDETHGDNVDPEESTTYIECILINPQTQLSCLYQILHYQIFKGVKRSLSTSDNLRTRLNNIHFSHLCFSTFYANM